MISGSNDIQLTTIFETCIIHTENIAKFIFRTYLSADPFGSAGVWESLCRCFPLLLSSPWGLERHGPPMYRGGSDKCGTQNSRNVYFLETKSPCWVAPNIEEGLRIYPNKINSSIQKSGKVGFPQKSTFKSKFTYQNSLFTENLNGPYGPYEQLLWDFSPNKWPQNRVFHENSLSWKTTMSKILENAVLARKKSAGCHDSKTKVVNIFRNIPDPNYIQKSVFFM